MASVGSLTALHCSGDSQDRQPPLSLGRPPRTLADMSNYDVVVVGGGAAGLSAALVLSRARRKVLVLDAGHPRNAPAAHMQGFLSRDGMPPAELLAHGRDEVRGYGGRVVTGAVEGITTCHKGGFRVLFSGGHQVTTRQVLARHRAARRAPRHRRPA